jgi:hypothetical protein
MAKIYRSVVPWVILQALCLGLVMLFPEIATWLPNYLLQDKNGQSCKIKFRKVARGNSAKLQNPLQA